MAEYVANAEHVGAAGTSAPGDPVALSTFAATTVILGCLFAGFIAPFFGAASVSFFAAVAFFGGLVLLLLGLRSSATLYIAYGGFLMTLGAVFVPVLGIASSALQHSSLLGLFFLTWTIFTGMYLLSTLRSSISTLLIHLLFFLAFLSFTIGELAGGSVFLSIGGWLAIICGLIAWYNAFVGLLSTDHSFFKLPAW